MNPIFDYGDTVLIDDKASERFNTGRYGSICGIYTIENIETATRYLQPIGSTLYLVEFNDGKTLSIPELFLLKAS